MMNETLLNTIVDKVDEHEGKITELHKIGAQTAGNTSTLNLIQTTVDEIKIHMQQVCFPESKIRELSNALDANLHQIKQPAQQKVIHHHHATTTLWITAALFLTVCLLAGGWYRAENKAGLYKDSDTKYRYLKLQGNIGLDKWCVLVDSLQIANANFRDIVLAKEEQERRDLVLLQRAVQMEREAKELKRQVKERSSSNSSSSKLK